MTVWQRARDRDTGSGPGPGGASSSSSVTLTVAGPPRPTRSCQWSGLPSCRQPQQVSSTSSSGGRRRAPATYDSDSAARAPGPALQLQAAARPGRLTCRANLRLVSGLQVEAAVTVTGIETVAATRGRHTVPVWMARTGSAARGRWRRRRAERVTVSRGLSLEVQLVTVAGPCPGPASLSGRRVTGGRPHDLDVKSTKTRRLMKFRRGLSDGLKGKQN